MPEGANLAAVTAPPKVSPGGTGPTVKLDGGTREQAKQPSVPEIARRNFRNRDRFQGFIVWRAGAGEVEERFEGVESLRLGDPLKHHHHAQPIVGSCPHLLAPMWVVEVRCIKVDEARQQATEGLLRAGMQGEVHRAKLVGQGMRRKREASHSAKCSA